MTDIPLGGGSGSSRAQQRFNNNFTSSDPDTSMGSTMAQMAGSGNPEKAALWGGLGGRRTPYEIRQGSETSGLNPMQKAGQGLMDFLGSGYNKLDEILDFKGMKKQIPYLLDNFIPGYEPPEGYYDDDYNGEPMAELGMNPFDVADLDDDNIAAQILAAQGYGNDEIISLLASRSI
jgi:hypothetical protein